MLGRCFDTSRVSNFVTEGRLLISATDHRRDPHCQNGGDGKSVVQKSTKGKRIFILVTISEQIFQVWRQAGHKSVE